MLQPDLSDYCPCIEIAENRLAFAARQGKDMRDNKE